MTINLHTTSVRGSRFDAAVSVWRFALATATAATSGFDPVAEQAFGAGLEQAGAVLVVRLDRQVHW